MQEAGLQQGLHQRLNAADVDEFRHRVVAGGTHVREYRHAVANAAEVVDGERYPGRVRDRQEVKNRIGRAFQCRHQGDRVLEGFHGEDVGGLDAVGDKTRDSGAGVVCVAPLVGAHRLLGRGVGQRQSHRLDSGRHGVGGVHSRARARSRNGGLFDREQLFVAHGTRRMATDRFEHGDDVPALDARLDRAAVDEHARPVETRHGHCTRRHVLVAAADGDEAIETLCSYDGLDGVGYHLPGHQRIAHARGTHGDAVGNRDRVEDHALGTGGVDTRGRRVCQFVDVHVAGRHHRPRRGDTHLRLGKVLALETDGIEHGAAGRLLDAVDDDGRVGAFGISHFPGSSFRPAPSTRKATGSWR